MFKGYLKRLSILRKFLFINFIFFIFIGSFTIIYLNNVEPNLIKKKSFNHTDIIDNTIDNIKRLNIKFIKEDIKKFLFSTRFIFQNLDRVIFFDNKLNLIGDTDTLDLDPRSFSTRLDNIEFEILNEEKIENKQEKKIDTENDKLFFLKDIISIYQTSKDYGKPYTFTQENLNQFQLTTIKNVILNEKNVGFLVIVQNANDVKVAIDERKTFVIRTVIVVGFVILIFSFVLNRYFLKPIQNLVSYTKTIKNKSSEKINIENLKNRNDELGLLSNSLDDMTNELQKRIFHAENFSTDLVHEIRNPLASLKSASEILQDTNNTEQRKKLLNILSHDVQRIERLITDYSQILKDEVALSTERMKKINIQPIIQSVVEDYNNIYNTKRGINISYENDGNNEFFINGIENRIEQITANLLDNSISFIDDNKNIYVKVYKNPDKKIIFEIIDEGQGFKEKDTEKIFKRFYSNRPENFGEHSGLGLNIVKNLVDLHEGSIKAKNRDNNTGAIIIITFPEI
ncbi:MAG: HAMP domain-containing histidine kinase [Pelagibacteraceae bacterium]|nr:HAMP domain-containing histidine kinase [Pelagibacteraceae bacterium]PHX89526.1 MAG: two-component sensor histidine kinase [Pelagibacteraceae bacterium]